MRVVNNDGLICAPPPSPPFLKFLCARGVFLMISKMAAAVQLPMQMDPLFLSLSFFRRRKHEGCVDVCTQMLQKNPYDQVIFEVSPIFTQKRHKTEVFFVSLMPCQPKNIRISISLSKNISNFMCIFSFILSVCLVSKSKGSNRASLRG